MVNYAITWILNKYQMDSPMINWIINMIGCLLIGSFYVLNSELKLINTEIFTVLTSGILTGFTNYALFSLESLQYLMKADYLRFGIYTGATVGMGMVFTFMGILFTRIIISK